MSMSAQLGLLGSLRGEVHGCSSTAAWFAIHTNEATLSSTAKQSVLPSDASR